MAATALSAPSGTNDPKVTAASKGAVPTASDASNGNSFANGGLELLVVDNVGASSRTLTVKDKNGNNAGVITIAANKCQVIGPFDVAIYGTTVTFTSSHAELEVLPVSLSTYGKTITGS